MDRQKKLNSLRENPEIPVLIIGAGINGIGTFRELAINGVNVLLVDRGDFCSGASSASSHMAHGGIRYLENGEFRLVREAVQERNRLIENAPHYVKPLPTTIPIFKWFSGLLNAPLKFMGWLDKPTERGVLVIKIGLIIYDFFTKNQKTVPRHIFRSKKQSLISFPNLNQNILFTATYYDGAILNPERLCIEMILDTENENPGAMALNYLSVEKSEGDVIFLFDQISNQHFEVKPSIVINAAGPWIDLVNNNIGYQTKFIGGTKGSHLVLDVPPLREAIRDNELFFENKDGRIVLIYPLYDKVLIGTSDIRIDNPDNARCTEQEVDYFLEMLKIVFPNIPVNRAHIVFQFSGVRPLPSSASSKTEQISRDHSIRIVEADSKRNYPIYNLIGGKWTTFRAFSEQSADLIFNRLGVSRELSTPHMAIGGGKNYPNTLEAKKDWLAFVRDKTGIPLERLENLFDRYGTRAAQLAGYLSVKGDIPLRTLSYFSQEEISFIVKNEGVVHLDDFLLRRSNLAKLGLLNQEIILEIASVISATSNWSSEHLENELKRAQNILIEKHRLKI